MSYEWIARAFLILGAICYCVHDITRGYFYFGAALFYMLESINEKVK